MKISVLFGVGIILLLFTHINMLKHPDQIVLMAVLNLVAVGFLIASIVAKKHRESYEYNYAMQTGKIIGGTVFASYPEATPGLGWVL